MRYSAIRLTQLVALRNRLNALGDMPGRWVREKEVGADWAGRPIYEEVAADTYPHGNASTWNKKRIRARNRLNRILRAHDISADFRQAFAIGSCAMARDACAYRSEARACRDIARRAVFTKTRRKYSALARRNEEAARRVEQEIARSADALIVAMAASLIQEVR